MAKITMGDFGQAVPQSRPTQTLSAAQIDGGLSEATQQLGNTAMSIAERDIQAKRAEELRLQREIEAERKADAARQAHRAEQTATANSMADIQLGMNTLLDEQTADLNAGKADKEAVRKSWAEKSSKIIDDAIAKMPPHLQDLTRANSRAFAGGLANRLEDNIRARDRQEADAGLITFRDKMERLAATDPALAIKQYNTVVDGSAGSAGWSPEKTAKDKQSFAEGVMYTRAYTMATAARRDNAALDALSKTLATPEFAMLDPQKRATLEHTIEGYRTVNMQQAEIRAQRAERLQERRLKQAEAAATSFQMVTDKGFAVSDEYFAKTMQMTAGTPFQATVVQLAKSAVETGGLAAQPIAQQRAAFDTVTQQIAREGATPALVKRRDQIEKVMNGSLRDAKEDGLQAYVDRSPSGTQIKPINIAGGIDGIVKGLGERRQLADEASAWRGAPVSPLKAEEVEPLMSFSRNLKPEQRAGFWSAVSNAVGVRGARGLAAQIAEKDRPLQLAIASGASQTTQGRLVGQLIFDGDQALKDGVVLKDDKKVTGWKATISKEVDGVFPSESENQAVKDSAFLITASIAKANGGFVSPDDVKRAVRLASGGGIVERNGARIPLPAGYDESMLDKRLKSLSVADVVPPQADQTTVRAAGVQVPMAEFLKTLPSAELRAAGPGRYMVIVNGRPVTTADGKQAVTIGAR